MREVSRFAVIDRWNCDGAGAAAGCAVVRNGVVDGVEREISAQHLVHDPLRLESNDPAAGVNEPSERHREDADIRAHFQDRHSGAGELLKEKHLVARDFTVLVKRASNVGVVDGVDHRTFAALLEPDVLACPERLYVHTDILAGGVCAPERSGART
jgi:hypothetical protein